ncbi:DUF1016 N-terminal domain-containing protein [Spirosoma koreense]
MKSVANSVCWNLGKLLLDKQFTEGYGSGVVKQLSIDLKNEFPDIGLSPHNMWSMKRSSTSDISGRHKTATVCSSFAVGTQPLSLR